MTDKKTTRGIARLGLLVLLGCATIAGAQEPANLKDNPLKGVIDFHVHSGPDSFTRSITDYEIAKVAKRSGMRALVLKNHFTTTADRAYLAEKATGMKCYGGIVLNRAVGGLNAEAVKRMLSFTGRRGKVIWLPTFDAENHVKHFKEKREYVSVVRGGKIVPKLQPILKLAAKHDLVLQTGHSSAEECLVIIKAARAAGVKKIVITHAMADPIGMTVAQMKQAAKLGAVMECVWLTNLTGPKSHLPSQRHWRKVTTDQYAKAMRAVGPKHFILSSDLGQFLNPIHTDGMKSFILGLGKAGIPAADIDLMCRRTPARLLGLKPLSKTRKSGKR